MSRGRSTDARQPLPNPARIAVLVPCLNESRTIGKVVDDFRAVAPAAAIYVIDNGSTDDTAAIARDHGAIVIAEPRRGKGRALRTAFQQADADVFVLADGDDQMPADRLPALLAPVLDGRADMAVGSRKLGTDVESHFINRAGNLGFSWLLTTLLGARVTDVLSGYRAVRRDVARALPLGASSFEVEVELTIKAAQNGYVVAEVPISVRARPLGNLPRIRVVRDGFRILGAIIVLLSHGRPLRFFGLLGAALGGFGVAAALIATVSWGSTLGMIAAVGAGVLVGVGCVSVATGVALDPIALRLRPVEDIGSIGSGMAAGSGARLESEMTARSLPKL